MFVKNLTHEKNYDKQNKNYSNMDESPETIFKLSMRFFL